MRLICLFCLAMMTCALSQTSIGFRNPDDKTPLTSYRLPTWGYQTFRLTFQGRGQGEKQDDAERYAYGMTNSALGAFSRFRESDIQRLRYSIGVTSMHEEDKGYSTGFDDNSLFQEKRQLGARLSANVDYDRYFGNIFHIGIEGNMHEGYTHIREYVLSEDDNPTWEKGRKNKTNSIGGRAAIKIGIGRLRTVTPVIRALRFRERFAKLELAPELTDEQVQELAGIISQYSGYNSVYDRQDKYFWDAVYQAVGVENLTPFQIHYLRESMFEYNGSRYEGWHIEARYNISTSHYDTSLEGYHKSLNQNVGLAVEWYKNPSLNHMLALRIIPGYEHREIPDYKEYRFTVSASFSHMWIIADRLTFATRARYNFGDLILHYNQPSDYEDISRDNEQFEFSTGPNYYFEDNLSLSVPLSLRKTNSDYFCEASVRLTWLIDRTLR